MSTARSSSLKRRVRRFGGKAIRRFGLLPGGTPDGLGEDDQLIGSSLPYTVMVFFADTPDALYQLEQWYPALRELNSTHPVVLVLRDSRTARAVRAKAQLPAIVVARYTTMDGLLAHSDVKLALYVNHNPENFSNLRFGKLIHVSLLHGDSDKSVSVSNQTKAYDYSFVAGEAAIDRLSDHTILFDAQERCIPIGRPQVDSQPADLTSTRDTMENAARAIVLYAPTWEGSQPSAAYSSVTTHGLDLVDRLITSGLFTVVYRPHPLTGVRDSRFGDADRAIRDRIAKARAAEPQAGHRTDSAPQPTLSFATADIMVCDISGMAQEWLPTGKPFVITTPTSPDAVVARTRISEVVPSMSVADVAEAIGLLRRHLTLDPTRVERRELISYYLGDITPGASTRRFVEACDRLVGIRDAEIDRIEPPVADRV